MVARVAEAAGASNEGQQPQEQVVGCVGLKATSRGNANILHLAVAPREQVGATRCAASHVVVCHVLGVNTALLHKPRHRTLLIPNLLDSLAVVMYRGRVLGPCC